MANVRGNVQRLPNLVFKLLTPVPSGPGLKNAAGEVKKMAKLEYEAPLNVSKVTVKQYFQQIYGHDIASVHTQIVPGRLKPKKLQAKLRANPSGAKALTGFQRPWKKVMVYLRTPLSLGAPFTPGALRESARALEGDLKSRQDGSADKEKGGRKASWKRPKPNYPALA